MNDLTHAEKLTLDRILNDAKTSTYINDAYYALLRHDLEEWDQRGTPLNGDERARYEDLVLHEHWLLDRRRFEEWYALYSSECVYWVPQAHAMPDVDTADPQTHVAVAFDDRRRMGDRLVWLRTGVAYSQLPPSWTSHSSTGFVRIPTDVQGEVKIRSQFVVHEVRTNYPVQSMTGWMGHVFTEEDGLLKIARKIVCLIDGDRAHHNLTFLL